MFFHRILTKLKHIPQKHNLLVGLHTGKIRQCCLHTGRVGIICIHNQGICLSLYHLGTVVGRNIRLDSLYCILK